MTVDAVVYCNCYETGRLCKPPPHPEYVFVSEYGGYLACNHPDIEVKMEFDQWQYSACEHEYGVLLHHFLGNINGIRIIRDELSCESTHFPIILNKIVYSGIHTGDFLKLFEVDLLTDELTLLEDFEGSTPERTEYIQYFCEQMIELIQAAQSVNKPICF